MRNSKYEIARVEFYLIDMNIYLVLPGTIVVKKGYVNCSVNHCICKLFVEKTSMIIAGVYCTKYIPLYTLIGLVVI